MAISFVSRETGSGACGPCVAAYSARFPWNLCEIGVETPSYGNNLYCFCGAETPPVLHLGVTVLDFTQPSLSLPQSTLVLPSSLRHSYWKRCLENSSYCALCKYKSRLAVLSRIAMAVLGYRTGSDPSQFVSTNTDTLLVKETKSSWWALNDIPV